MTHLRIAHSIYQHFISLSVDGKIPVNMVAPALVGTVQDDPFDRWVAAHIEQALPQLEIKHSGSLTTPDLMLRDRTDGLILGLEIKKLIQKPSGHDSRGLTLDYNSCIPCGSSLINVGPDTVQIPTFYLFCLLSHDSTQIVTMILMDGDFLNYDFNLHKQAKVANITEYKRGPYGEGSVRRRAMYTYPNPLNYKLKFFHLRQILVMKHIDSERLELDGVVTDLIHREDIYKKDFHYVVIDETKDEIGEVAERFDIFAACKARTGRDRVPSVPALPKFIKP
jgi:hypothetical protein